VEKEKFSVPTPCLYHGSMVEWHGDAMVHGPYIDGSYRVIINHDVVLYTANRESFTVNALTK